MSSTLSENAADSFASKRILPLTTQVNHMSQNRTAFGGQGPVQASGYLQGHLRHAQRFVQIHTVW